MLIGVYLSLKPSLRSYVGYTLIIILFSSVLEASLWLEDLGLSVLKQLGLITKITWILFTILGIPLTTTPSLL
jgi:hypothetical protein